MSTEAQEDPQSQSLSLNFNEPIYAVGFSKDESAIRLAVSSVNYGNVDNQLYLIESPKVNHKLGVKKTIPIRYPVTKIKWHPESHTGRNQLFATTSDILRIYSAPSDGNAELHCELKPTGNTDMNAPYTSFDWCNSDPRFICCSSIANTCSLWDWGTQTLLKQVIAHDKEVLDVSFAKNEQVFVTVSADFTLRRFDIRALNTCELLYEAKEPLLRVAYNKTSNMIAVTTLNQNNVLIIDPKKPQNPVYVLEYHKDQVNAIDWSPTTHNMICSISEDKHALLWSFNSSDSMNKVSPLLEYTNSLNMLNISWCEAHPDWIGIVMDNSFNVIKTTI